MIHFNLLRECITALRESPDPGLFNMRRVLTAKRGRLLPCCAWGHYSYRHYGLDWYDALFTLSLPMYVFGLTLEQSAELFGPFGCGGAQTTDEAIAYIEGFIARHKPTPKPMPSSVRRIFEAPFVVRAKRVKVTSDVEGEPA